jgi:hypothetical protein
MVERTQSVGVRDFAVAVIQAGSLAPAWRAP